MRSPVIGLTGPTGAGKSTWSAAFRALHCTVIDCDRLARRAVEQPQVRQALEQAFGAEIYRDGVLNRRLLATRAFADAQSVQKLNAATHPAIRAAILSELHAAERKSRAVIIDAPQLYEGGLETVCTTVAAVLAPEPLRLARILQRDKISREEAVRRMASQFGEAFFRSHADWILDGTLPPAEVPAHAERQLRIWLGECL
ncbi:MULTISPECIES: dephospho-CoA kinase [Caproicibacterium]|uniref:Dephospho-CoA kinase n=1 Tax=Caproicibacterium argilliputei TaxID=3030016 RepID=A0AA97D7T6_9FIRM|nr:dephospho-CoA kinase [Caproicibacterium argilliputei]WOC31239.1 dephospho-CoA kinase [Caproicibacterium argilliputei]